MCDAICAKLSVYQEECFCALGEFHAFFLPMTDSQFSCTASD